MRKTYRRTISVKRHYRHNHKTRRLVKVSAHKRKIESPIKITGINPTRVSFKIEDEALETNIRRHGDIDLHGEIIGLPRDVVDSLKLHVETVIKPFHLSVGRLKTEGHYDPKEKVMDFPISPDVGASVAALENKIIRLRKHLGESRLKVGRLKSAIESKREESTISERNRFVNDAMRNIDKYWFYTKSTDKPVLVEDYQGLVDDIFNNVKHSNDPVKTSEYLSVITGMDVKKIRKNLPAIREELFSRLTFGPAGSHRLVSDEKGRLADEKTIIDSLGSYSDLYGKAKKMLLEAHKNLVKEGGVKDVSGRRIPVTVVPYEVSQETTPGPLQVLSLAYNYVLDPKNELGRKIPADKRDAVLQMITQSYNTLKNKQFREFTGESKSRDYDWIREDQKKVRFGLQRIGTLIKTPVMSETKEELPTNLAGIIYSNIGGYVVPRIGVRPSAAMMKVSDKKFRKTEGMLQELKYRMGIIDKLNDYDEAVRVKDLKKHTSLSLVKARDMMRGMLENLTHPIFGDAVKAPIVVRMRGKVRSITDELMRRGVVYDDKNRSYSSDNAVIVNSLKYLGKTDQIYNQLLPKIQGPTAVYVKEGKKIVNLIPEFTMRGTEAIPLSQRMQMLDTFALSNPETKEINVSIARGEKLLMLKGPKNLTPKQQRKEFAKSSE
jgi:hypothetical protein